jgi:hypothetical protein
MKVTKTSRHLGQSVTMGALFALTSIGIVSLIAMQSGSLP